MPLSPQKLSSLLKLRAIGWSQSEIAESLGISQQVVAYNLKKLKKEAKEKSPDEDFHNDDSTWWAGSGRWTLSD